MNNNLVNLDDVLLHIEKNNLANNNTLLLNNCIFNFNLNIEYLYLHLEQKCTNIERIKFSNSTFTSPVHYQSNEATFSLSFEKICFESDIIIENIHFKKDINFIDSLFKGKTTFTFLSFDNYFRLFGSIFSNDVNFAHSELNDKTFFLHTPKIEFNLKEMSTLQK